MKNIDVLLKSGFRKTTIDVDGTKFVIREMNAGELEEYTSGLYKVGKGGAVEYNTKDAQSKLVFLCLHDENEERVFTKEADLVLIKRMPSSLVNRIFEEATKLNNLDPKAQEETEKN